MSETRTIVFGSQGRADEVTITFLANEGVMLSSGRQKVLIDALFHVGTDETDRSVRDVRSVMPNAVTFVRSLETRQW